MLRPYVFTESQAMCEPLVRSREAFMEVMCCWKIPRHVSKVPNLVLVSKLTFFLSSFNKSF